MSQDAPLPPDETACPSCGERILAAAKKCKHCGEWIASQPNPILAQQANYSVPLRIERQEQSGGGGGGGGRGGGSSYSTSSIGIATQGSVCPQCKEPTGFVNTYSMWHWVLALLFFPIGLLCLLFPIKVCARCGTTFGAGVQMAKTVRIIAILYLSAILLIAVSCFGAIAVGGYTAAKAVDKAGATVNAAHQVEDAIAATTEKAYIATMKSDLRNLVTAQEAYFSDNAGTYAASTTALGTTYQPASSVTVTLSNVTTTGWTATASHTSTAKTCSISMGGTSTNEGEPVCK